MSNISSIRNGLTNALKRLKAPHWVRLLFMSMSAIERVLFAWLVLLLIGSGIWSIVSYIGRNTELIAQSGGTYFEAAVGQPRHINPILAGANDLDVDIAELVYSSLFQLDDNLELQKDLATEYSLASAVSAVTEMILSSTVMLAAGVMVTSALG